MNRVRFWAVTVIVVTVIILAAVGATPAEWAQSAQSQLFCVFLLFTPSLLCSVAWETVFILILCAFQCVCVCAAEDTAEEEEERKCCWQGKRKSKDGKDEGSSLRSVLLGQP